MGISVLTFMRVRGRLLLLAVLAIVQWAWLVKAVPELKGNDFGIFYRSVASDAPYAGHEGNPATDAGILLTNLNPPQFLLALKPFTLLPFAVACVAWWTLSFALLIAALTWWLRAQGERWTPERVVWALLWTPIFTMGFTGQVTAVLGLPLWLAYRDLNHGRSWRGGLWAGVVLSVKPILWPLALWYVARRAWSTMAGMIVGAAASVAVGVACYGVAMYRAWIEALGAIAWGPQIMNASLRAIGSRLPFETPAFIWLAAGLVVGLWTVWRTRTRTLEDAWFALIAASLLASPLGWIYYGVWLLPGTRANDWTRGVARGWCMPLLIVVELGRLSPVVWATLGSCYGLTLFALWWRSVGRSGDPSPVTTNQPAVLVAAHPLTAA
jgi:Glycosyltransferase family 87